MDLRTKALMVCSSAVMVVLGLGMTLGPQELLAYFGFAGRPFLELLVQTAGALYLGFAMLNWMAKDSLIGGIYSRPVAMGNFVHFFVLDAALLKLVAKGHRSTMLLVASLLYLFFAAWFALVAFTSPSRSETVPVARS